MTIKVGQPLELKVTKRYWVHNRQFAIRDAFDALVELITNADDSYHKLYKHKLIPKDGGRILIETLARKNDSSLLIVRDRAEGMTLDTMIEKLLNVGRRSSEEGDRGIMGRGAKDVTELGDTTFESIVDGKYYKVKITSGGDFIPLENRRTVTQELRKSLHIGKRNGTVVTIELTRHSLPRSKTICENLPFHFALRDIMAEDSPCHVRFKDLNSNDNVKRLIYYQPQAELVCKEEFIVPGYPDAKAKLIIFRSPEPLVDISDKFRKSGLIIKGRRAIHECSLLQNSFENDVYGKKYFGRIECEYLDFLIDEYDKKIESRLAPTIENPSLVIDPNRQYGLKKEHPFVKALFDLPTQRLKELIDKDHAALKKPKEEIVDEELRKRFDKLAQAASKFLIQQVEDLDEPSIDEGMHDDSFTKRGLIIYPTYANVALGNVRSFGLYVDRRIFNKEEEVSLKKDSDAIEFLNPFVKLVAHKKRNNLLYGRFSIKGISLKEGVIIETQHQRLPKAEAFVTVVENKIEEREFISSLEFEYKHYKIRERSSKTIKLFAKYPELIHAETEIKVTSSDNVSLPIKGRCILVPVQGSNFARADITIEARRLCHETINLSAKLADYEAVTKVKVTQKEESGPPLKIEIKDEDFGSYRAKWGDHEGKPYLLLISAKHSSLKRYLGPHPNFVGRESIHFRAILAEIVAECVCRKSLFLEAQHHSWMFQWANSKEDYIIADAVVAELQKRMKEFLPVAHKIMIEDREIS